MRHACLALLFFTGCGSGPIVGDPGSPTPQEEPVCTATPDGPARATITDHPMDGAVVPRDLVTNEATLRIEGTLESSGWDALVAEVHRDGALHATVTQELCSDDSGVAFDLAPTIPAELASFDLEVFVVADGARESLLRVEDVVAGDILLIQGQSNAVARAYSGDANPGQGPFLRSFGARTEDLEATDLLRDWYPAEGNETEGPGAVGQWGLTLGRLLMSETGVPLGILNGARGGRAIAYFQRNDDDRTDLTTNYGRLLARAQWAEVSDRARAILYYQGESDGADATGHRAGFADLVADWREDFPNVEVTYTTQVRTGCGNPTLELRDGQRRIADELEGLSVMSTTGLDGHDGCHFSFEDGYEALAERYAGVLLRDLYGSPSAPGLDPPDVATARWTDGGLRLETRDASDDLSIVGDPSGDFLLSGTDAAVTSVTAEGNAIILTLDRDATGAGSLGYTGHSGAGDWVLGSRGIGLLTFAELPIE